mmetsp:Transcript_30473/g.48918  ORF Transcript_30473/g.48918 Transcript_30473/m.48918 type:complete len:217 (+) Transcript_30473:1027-1677(+)
MSADARRGTVGPKEPIPGCEPRLVRPVSPPKSPPTPDIPAAIFSNCSRCSSAVIPAMSSQGGTVPAAIDAPPERLSDWNNSSRLRSVFRFSSKHDRHRVLETSYERILQLHFSQSDHRRYACIFVSLPPLLPRSLFLSESSFPFCFRSLISGTGLHVLVWLSHSERGSEPPQVGQWTTQSLHRNKCSILSFKSFRLNCLPHFRIHGTVVVGQTAAL